MRRKTEFKASGKISLLLPLWTFVLFALFSASPLFAQSLTVKGKVTNRATRESVPSANVVVKGTSIGVMSDMDGNYSINVPSAESTLEFSFIGYTQMEVKVGGRTTIDVQMNEDSQVLNEVVVTAMGIERKSTSLTYSTDIVKGAELTRNKETNMINSLQGKSAGLVITPNASGAGGSSRILLRGNKSATGSNQPLIVIDGIPMSNPPTVQQTSEFAGRDGGDAISNLNPDDVASINILKGASAAALYGSMAANGVILITTKKGKEGKVRVDFSSNATFETILVSPELQDRYGATVSGNSLSQKSWGVKRISDAPGGNRKSDFFRIGSSLINAVSINGGSEKSQSYMSYANTTANGIVPTNTFMRHNMNVRQTFNLLENRLVVDGSVNYITQHGENRPGGGTYSNALTGVYSFPANGDFKYYKDNFEVFDPSVNRNVQNWYTEPNDFAQNPYWVLNRNKSYESRDRIIASSTVKLKLMEGLNLQGRLSFDKTKDSYEQKIYASTPVSISHASGRYKRYEFEPTQFYGDILLNYNKTINDFELSASVGSSFLDYQSKILDMDSDKLGLIVPNFFVLENVNGNPAVNNSAPRKRLNSVFGTAQIGYKGMIYADITGRNDWSSTLAYTNNMSYFYPSFGLTALVNEMVTLPELFNLMKVRGSYSIVGNDVPAYITRPKDFISNGVLKPNTVAPFAEMKPEKIHSMEFGLDVAMLKNKINFDFTYYKTNSKNQYFTVSASPSSGNQQYSINTGNIQNEGIETSFSYNHNFSSDFVWKTGVNASYNKNTVKELDPLLGEKVVLGSGAGFQFVLKEGGSFGDIYTRKLQKDANGVVKTDKDGNPLVGGDYEYVGNVNAKWNLGWFNTFTYKNISLYFLVDGKVGGNTVGMTQSMLDSYGVTKVTADARDNGGVDLGNGTKIEAEQYYSAVAGRDKAGDQYTYKLTNFRLRELSLGYTFDNLLGESRNLGVSLIARNLFIIYKDSPHDPDMSISTANGFQGFDIFGLPSTRSIGVNLKINF